MSLCPTGQNASAVFVTPTGPHAWHFSHSDNYTLFSSPKLHKASSHPSLPCSGLDGLLVRGQPELERPWDCSPDSCTSDVITGVLGATMSDIWC